MEKDHSHRCYLTFSVAEYMLTSPAESFSSYDADSILVSLVILAILVLIDSIFNAEYFVQPSLLFQSEFTSKP